MEKNGILDQFLKEIGGWEEVKKKNVDEFIESFCKQIGLKIKMEVELEIEDLYLYLVDISSLGIKTLEKIPLLLIKTMGLDKKEIDSLYRNIERILFNLNLKEYLVFVVPIGDSRRLKKLAEESIFDLVILDKEVKNILQRDSKKKLIDSERVLYLSKIS